MFSFLYIISPFPAFPISPLHPPESQTWSWEDLFDDIFITSLELPLIVLSVFSDDNKKCYTEKIRGQLFKQAVSPFLLTEKVIIFYLCVDLFSAKLLKFCYSFDNGINEYVHTDHNKTWQWIRITNMLQDYSLQMWLRCLSCLNFVLPSDWRVIRMTFWSAGKSVTNCPTESSKSRNKIRNRWQTRCVILQ